MDIELAQALKETADAKELIRKMLHEYNHLCLITRATVEEAERFLISPEDRFEVTKEGKKVIKK